MCSFERERERDFRGFVDCKDEWNGGSLSFFFFSQIIDLDEDQPFGNSSNRWMRVSSPLSYFDEEHVGTRGF